jgi:hypothetical protein
MVIEALSSYLLTLFHPDLLQNRHTLPWPTGKLNAAANLLLISSSFTSIPTEKHFTQSGHTTLNSHLKLQAAWRLEGLGVTRVHFRRNHVLQP